MAELRSAIYSFTILILTSTTALAQIWPFGEAGGPQLPVTSINSPIIDGTATNTSGNNSSIILTLSTTTANDIIVVVVAASTNVAVTNVSSTNTASWGSRSGNAIGGGGQLSYWTGTAASVLTNESITVTLAAGALFAASAFAIKGTASVGAFDGNAALPSIATGAGGTNAIGTVTTSHNDDYILFLHAGLGSISTTAPAGYSQIARATNASAVQVNVDAAQVSATQSAVGLTDGNDAQAWTTIVDAYTSDTPVSMAEAASAVDSPGDTLTMVVSQTEAGSAVDWLSTQAGGGGGGGAGGATGVGEAGANATLDGTGGYGGSADAFATARQTTPGSNGNNGTEFPGGTVGAGSGGAGGNWNNSGTGQAGGIGGLYGGGGGGGGGGTVAGGAGGLGGAGFIYLHYGSTTITLTSASSSPFTFPSDWTPDSSEVVIVAPGGCGAAGSIVAGGNGGGGGTSVGALNTEVFSANQVISFSVPTAAQVCAGTALVASLGSYSAPSGKNGDGTGGTGTLNGIPGTGPLSSSFVYQPGAGGPGGRFSQSSVLLGGKLLLYTPLVHFW